MKTEKENTFPTPLWYQPKIHGAIEVAPSIDIKGDVFNPVCILNKGRFATAYCMRNSAEDVLVARVSYDADDADRFRVAEECLRGASSLFVCVPFLTRVMSLDVDNLQHYFLHISTFCPGGDLLDMYAELYDSKLFLSEAQLFPWMCQLVEAVSFLHEHHLFHCDIKLSNLVVDAEGSLRLTDFGCARCGLPDGTLYPCPSWVNADSHMGHMPPESFAVDRPCVYNNTLDWYQLGACLYTLLEKERPLSHLQGISATPELSERLRNEKVQLSRSDLSPELCDFVASLLAGDYKDRLGGNGRDFVDVWHHDFLMKHSAMLVAGRDVTLMRDLVRQQACLELKPQIRPMLELSCHRCRPSGTLANKTSLSERNIEMTLI